MNNIKAVIADDETLCRDVIREYLRQHPAVQVQAECSTGIEAVNAVTEHQPDILFLDIQMPDLDGFGALKELDGDALPLVIFTTAYDKYALRAFDASAIDYLLKPFDQQRFDTAMEKAQRYMGRAGHGTREWQRQQLLQNVGDRATRKFMERLLVKENKKLIPVCVNDVEVFEADNDYVRLHLSNSHKKYLVNNSLAYLESALNPANFVRIHKSAIIKIGAIAEMQPHTNGEFKILMKSGIEAKLSRTYKDAIPLIFQ